jgi:ribonuclease HI
MKKKSILYTLHFDGSCEPFNPGGKMGMGTIVKKDGVTIWENSEFTPANPENTNNVAEYKALINGLNYLLSIGAENEKIKCYGDSLMVINQMSGEWTARGGRYYDSYKSAMQVHEKFKRLSYHWVNRNKNQEADKLSKLEKI